jgi:hypothetical protein
MQAVQPAPSYDDIMRLFQETVGSSKSQRCKKVGSPCKPVQVIKSIRYRISDDTTVF